MSLTKDEVVPTNDVGDAMDAPVRVFLWSLPRTCSTVLLKCMSFVEGCAAWMEPYNMCYLNSTHYNPDYLKEDPDMIAYWKRIVPVLESLEMKNSLQDIEQKASALDNLWDQSKFTYPWLQKELSSDEPNKRVIFIKDHSFAISGREEFLPEIPFRHSFLIRHPREMFSSFRRFVTPTVNFSLIEEEDCDPVRDCPSLPVEDLYKFHYDHYKYISKHVEPNPIVIDAHDLGNNPRRILSKYFNVLGIPFKDSYLTWGGDTSYVEKTFRGSPIGVLTFAEHETLNPAFNSSKFSPPKYPRGFVGDGIPTSDQVERLIQEAMPYYEKMYANRLVIDG